MRVLHLGRPEYVEGASFSTTAWVRSAYWDARHQGTLRKPLGGLGDDILGDPLVAPVRDTVVRPLLDMLEYSAPAVETLKEYVFDEVRQVQFPERPSRRRCLFALPPDLDEQGALELLGRMGLLGAKRPLVELELHGAAVHLAASSLLNCNSKPPAGIEDNARAYWSGEGEIDEVLYEGAFTIRRVVAAST